MSLFYQRIRDNARSFPEREALIEGDTRWTFSDLLNQIDQAAGGFIAKGVQPGDRVGLMMHNQKEFLVCTLALRKTGAVVVPINIGMLPRDIAHVIQDSGLRLLVVADSLHPHVQHVPLPQIIVGDEAASAENSYRAFIAQGAQAKTATLEASPEAEDALAFLIYTSGTTGLPKGVMLTEANLMHNIDGFTQIIDFNPNDRLLQALPLFHAYGLMVGLVILTLGIPQALIPKFHPKNIVETLVREKITILPLVPTLYTVILEVIAKYPGGLSLPELRYCISGGAALPAALLKQIESVLGATVLEGYGMTEASPVLAVNDPKVGSIPGSVGKPLPNMQIRIVDDTGADVPQGQAGEIWAKGDNVMQGYYRLPEETRHVLTSDGWLKTGDLGHLDEQGRLYISGGRKKDLIIKAGENISPGAIEEVLYSHPAVREAAVVGLPDPRLGEDIVAFVSLKEGMEASPQEIQRFCRENLPATYVPARVEILPDLPKNPTGKIVKKLLREQLIAR